MGLKKEFFCKGEPPSEITFSDPWSLVKTAVDNLSSFFVQKHINMRKTGLTSINRKNLYFYKRRTVQQYKYNQTVQRPKSKLRLQSFDRNLEVRTERAASSTQRLFSSKSVQNLFNLNNETNTKKIKSNPKVKTVLSVLPELKKAATSTQLLVFFQTILNSKNVNIKQLSKPSDQKLFSLNKIDSSVR